MKAITTLFASLVITLALVLSLSLNPNLAGTNSAQAAFSFSAGTMRMSFLSFAQCLETAIKWGKKSHQTMTEEKIDRSRQTYLATFQPKSGSNEKPASIKCEGGSLLMQNMKVQF